jgi:excisionase family DNA binding protein
LRGTWREDTMEPCRHGQFLKSHVRRFPQVTTQWKPADSVGGRGERLLRISEVAERLSVSPSMAWKLTATGELRSVRIGRAVRIRPSDLEAYLERAAGEG